MVILFYPQGQQVCVYLKKKCRFTTHIPLFFMSTLKCHQHLFPTSFRWFIKVDCIEKKNFPHISFILTLTRKRYKKFRKDRRKKDYDAEGKMREFDLPSIDFWGWLIKEVSLIYRIRRYYWQVGPLLKGGNSNE